MILRLQVRYLLFVFRFHSGYLLFKFEYTLLELEDLALRRYRKFLRHMMESYILVFRYRTYRLTRRSSAAAGRERASATSTMCFITLKGGHRAGQPVSCGDC